MLVLDPRKLDENRDLHAGNWAAGEGRNQPRYLPGISLRSSNRLELSCVQNGILIHIRGRWRAEVGPKGANQPGRAAILARQPAKSGEARCVRSARRGSLVGTQSDLTDGGARLAQRGSVVGPPPGRSANGGA